MVVDGQFAVYNFCYIWDFFQHKKSFITQLLLPTQYFYDVTSERTWKKTRMKLSMTASQIFEKVIANLDETLLKIASLTNAALSVNYTCFFASC